MLALSLAQAARATLVSAPRLDATSGWDFSSRWLADGRTLASIHTTDLVPVDLNSLLYGLERAIQAGCAQSHDLACEGEFRRRADDRARAVRKSLWDPQQGAYRDYDWTRRVWTQTLSAATLYPLFTGLASQDQAQRVAAFAGTKLLAPGGLRTTLSRTGQQWDDPNGWAPLQWIAVEGLSRYGETALAHSIADRWSATVRREYSASGRLLEKYDVEEVRPSGGGEYPLQDGFGWTNGVFRALSAPQARRAQRHPPHTPS